MKVSSCCEESARGLRGETTHLSSGFRAPCRLACTPQLPSWSGKQKSPHQVQHKEQGCESKRPAHGSLMRLPRKTVSISSAGSGYGAGTGDGGDPEHTEHTKNTGKGRRWDVNVTYRDHWRKGTELTQPGGAWGAADNSSRYCYSSAFSGRGAASATHSMSSKTF